MTKLPSKHSSDDALEARITAAVATLRESESFPSLSSFEQRAFEHWFDQGFHDRVEDKARKTDWTGALERFKSAQFNQNAYDAGYDAAQS